MAIEILRNVDMSRGEEPAPGGDLREFLEGFLGYQRHEFVRKLRDLTPEGLVSWSIPPLQLSVLGLVRHMTQMEHGYLTWGLGGGERKPFYGEDDYAGGSVDTVAEDLRLYFAEVEAADEAIASLSQLDSPGAGHGRPLGPTLVKMIDEYALHAGQAHMLRFAVLGELIR